MTTLSIKIAFNQGLELPLHYINFSFPKIFLPAGTIELHATSKTHLLCEINFTLPSSSIILFVIGGLKATFYNV